MLYSSLVLSAVLLLITNRIVWKAEHPVHEVLTTSALGLFCISLPPVFLQTVLLGVIVSVWGMKRWRRSVFFALSWAATLFSYGVFGAIAFHQTMQLQQEFPYVSMEDRLPSPKATRPVATLSPTASYQLDAMENLLENRDGLNNFLAASFRAIHEDAIRMFVNQPGFGVTRMIGISPDLLKRRLRQEPRIPQPGHAWPSPWLLGSLHIGPDSSKDDDSLLPLHQGSVVDFVNADNFGFFKDRQHVAGFQEHQISQTPSPSEPWTLQTLDLIGVVLHEKPVVYVSKYLPRMDELRAAPTRSLDDFEAAGLAALERGEELFVRDRGEERRMVGAIRAARQCLACHGGARGELLGAFSYRLTQDWK